jgi:hypothetical protein
MITKSQETRGWFPEGERKRYYPPFRLEILSFLNSIKMNSSTLHSQLLLTLFVENIGQDT